MYRTTIVPKHRKVGAYAGLVKERFERCLDLYLCPRAFKRRLNIDPESLVPRLPRPRELKPFPNALGVEYVGHASRVQCLACSGDGQWLASGDEDGMVILWEVRKYACGRVNAFFCLLFVLDSLHTVGKRSGVCISNVYLYFTGVIGG